jgi:flagellar protein FlaG
MSISTSPMIAGDRLQQVQPSMKPPPPPMANGSARAASVNVGALNMPVANLAADAKVSEAGKLSADQVQHSLQEINKVLTGLSISVRFQVDPQFKEVIIKVVDQENGRVIRQIPTEDVVRIAKAMDDLTGLLVAQKA